MVAASEIVGMDLTLPPLTPGFLVVDDDPAIRGLVANLVRRQYPRCEAAASLSEARAKLAAERFDIVFLDLSLPDGPGSLLLEEGELLAESLVLVITALLELQTAVQVMRRGAYDYISKPFSVQEFDERLNKAVEEWRTRLRYRHYQQHLEKLVNLMTEKVLATSEHIENTYDMTVAALGAALDLRDPETEEHCRRVVGKQSEAGAGHGACSPQPCGICAGARTCTTSARSASRSTSCPRTPA